MRAVFSTLRKPTVKVTSFRFHSLKPLALRLTRPTLALKKYHTSKPVSAGMAALSQHKNELGNTEGVPFDFDEEHWEEAKKHIAKYPPQYKKSAVIPLLDLAQRQNGGWLPLSAMNKVAKILEMKNIEVYEVATFYSMFNRVKVGKIFLQICTTTPCMVNGAYEILKVIEDHLGIHPGQTTDDGLFTLVEVECLGACVNAPMMQIGDYYYEDLTPETTRELLDKLKAGEHVIPGPQSGKRRNAEGPLGKTTLLGDVPGPGFKFRKDLDEPAKATSK